MVASLERMTQVLEFLPDDRYIVAEPGLTNGEVQNIAGQAGFFWPPDPSSNAFCSIGNNLAYNSAGPRDVHFRPI